MSDKIESSNFPEEAKDIILREEDNLSEHKNKILSFSFSPKSDERKGLEKLYLTVLAQDAIARTMLGILPRQAATYSFAEKAEKIRDQQNSLNKIVGIDSDVNKTGVNSCTHILGVKPSENPNFTDFIDKHTKTIAKDQFAHLLFENETDIAEAALTEFAQAKIAALREARESKLSVAPWKSGLIKILSEQYYPEGNVDRAKQSANHLVDFFLAKGVIKGEIAQNLKNVIKEKETSAEVLESLYIDEKVNDSETEKVSLLQKLHHDILIAQGFEKPTFEVSALADLKYHYTKSNCVLDIIKNLREQNIVTTQEVREYSSVKEFDADLKKTQASSDLSTLKKPNDFCNAASQRILLMTFTGQKTDEEVKGLINNLEKIYEKELDEDLISKIKNRITESINSIKEEELKKLDDTEKGEVVNAAKLSIETVYKTDPFEFKENNTPDENAKILFAFLDEKKLTKEETVTEKFHRNFLPSLEHQWLKNKRALSVILDDTQSLENKYTAAEYLILEKLIPSKDKTLITLEKTEESIKKITDALAAAEITKENIPNSIDEYLDLKFEEKPIQESIDGAIVETYREGRKARYEQLYEMADSLGIDSSTRLNKFIDDALFPSKDVIPTLADTTELDITHIETQVHLLKRANLHQNITLKAARLSKSLFDTIAFLSKAPVTNGATLEAPNAEKILSDCKKVTVEQLKSLIHEVQILAQEIKEKIKFYDLEIENHKNKADYLAFINTELDALNTLDYDETFLKKLKELIQNSDIYSHIEVNLILDSLPSIKPPAQMADKASCDKVIQQFQARIKENIDLEVKLLVLDRESKTSLETLDDFVNGYIKEEGLLGKDPVKKLQKSLEAIKESTNDTVTLQKTNLVTAYMKELEELQQHLGAVVNSGLSAMELTIKTVDEGICPEIAAMMKNLKQTVDVLSPFSSISLTELRKGKGDKIESIKNAYLSAITPEDFHKLTTSVIELIPHVRDNEFIKKFILEKLKESKRKGFPADDCLNAVFLFVKVYSEANALHPHTPQAIFNLQQARKANETQRLAYSAQLVNLKTSTNLTEVKQKLDDMADPAKDLGIEKDTLSSNLEFLLLNLKESFTALIDSAFSEEEKLISEKMLKQIKEVDAIPDFYTKALRFQQILESWKQPTSFFPKGATAEQTLQVQKVWQKVQQLLLTDPKEKIFQNDSLLKEVDKRLKALDQDEKAILRKQDIKAQVVKPMLSENGYIVKVEPVIYQAAAYPAEAMSRLKGVFKSVSSIFSSKKDKEHTKDQNSAIVDFWDDYCKTWDKFLVDTTSPQGLNAKKISSGIYQVEVSTPDLKSFTVEIEVTKHYCNKKTYPGLEDSYYRKSKVIGQSVDFYIFKDGKRQPFSALNEEGNRAAERFTQLYHEKLTTYVDLKAQHAEIPTLKTAPKFGMK